MIPGPRYSAVNIMGEPSGDLIVPRPAPTVSESREREAAEHRCAELEALAEELLVHRGYSVDIAFAQAETFLRERDRRRASR